MFISKKHSTLENTRSLQVPLKYTDASAPLKLQYGLNKNICQIHCKYKVHGCGCSFKIDTVSIKEWMVATTFANKEKLYSGKTVPCN